MTDFHPFVTPTNKNKIKLPDFTCEDKTTINIEELEKVKFTKKDKKIKVTHLTTIKSISDVYKFYKAKRMKAGPFKKIISNSGLKIDVKTAKTIDEGFKSLIASNTDLSVQQLQYFNENLNLTDD